MRPCQAHCPEDGQQSQLSLTVCAQVALRGSAGRHRGAKPDADPSHHSRKGAELWRPHNPWGGCVGLEFLEGRRYSARICVPGMIASCLERPLRVGTRRSDRMSRPTAAARWRGQMTCATLDSRFAYSECRCYSAATMAPYRRTNKTIAFSCDAGCGSQCRTTETSFRRAMQTLHQRGWSVKRHRDRWLHHCPVCAKAIREGRPVPCQLVLGQKPVNRATVHSH